MDALFRAVRKSPNPLKGFGRSKSRSKAHEKLSENWGENNEPVKEGVTFYVKYLGSTLVDELEDGESYGEGTSSEAVKIIVAMAKTTGKKLPKMSITVSPKGIKTVNMTTKEVLTEITIYRVNFCTADNAHEKVFAYIARSNENDTMECHAFLCPKKKIAQAVTLTVAQAFNIALEAESKEDKEKRNSEMVKQEKAKSSPVSMETNSHGDKSTKEGNLVDTAIIAGDLPEPFSSSSPPSKSSRLTHEGASIETLSSHLSSTGNNNTSNHTNGTMTTTTTTTSALGFDDDFGNDDEFSMLAQERSHVPQQPMAGMNGNNPFNFNTGLRMEDIDDDIMQFMDSRRGLEEFSRQKSHEDLLNL